MAGELPMDLTTLLEQWGFGKYIERFIEQEIDLETLIELDKETIKELIPKLGPRLNFLKKLESYRMILKAEIMPVSTEETLIAPNTPISIVMSDTSSASSSRVYVEDKNLMDFTITQTNLTDAGRAFETATRSKNAFKGLDNFEKACRPIYNLNIEQFLEESTLGKFVLAVYKTEKVLNRKSRSILVDLLVKGAMSQSSGRLLPIDFELLTYKICEFFKTENSGTYYIPRSSRKDPKRSRIVNPKGKLIDKYRNLRRLFKAILPEQETEAPVSSNDNKDAKESALWLKHNTEPWESVIQSWDKSFDLRRQCKHSTVAEFLMDWPILKISSYYAQLVEHDFKKIYPETTMKLYIHWHDFFKKLLNHKGKLDQMTEEMISICLSSTVSEDSACAIQIFCLASIFPPRGKVETRRKGHWKPSIQECQESVICHVKVPGDIEAFIQKKKNSKEQTIQPYIIIQGPTLHDVQNTYIVIDDIIIKSANVLQAFDITFKSFHVLDAEYPAAAEHLWLLIQKVVYEIETTHDKQIPYVISLCNDILKETDP